MTEEKYYIFNLETTKIELEFDKEEYLQLTAEQKKLIKGAFLFSSKSKHWISRAKEPNLYHAKSVAQSLGFTKPKRVGERLTYAEQLERKKERSEGRAERYGVYAQHALSRTEELQRPLKSMSGDIAFFTQPIIPGHSGSQAFARRREKLYARYEKGFEEYRKSEYFRNRAEIASETAKMKGLNDKAFIYRRVEEANKSIRKRKKNVEYYETLLKNIENGDEPKRYNGELFTLEEVTEWLSNELELIEATQDKIGYLLNRLDELGGIHFSKTNIQVGYKVMLKKWGLVEVIGRGPKNIKFKIIIGGAAGATLTAAYAEILEIKESTTVVN